MANHEDDVIISPSGGTTGGNTGTTITRTNKIITNGKLLRKSAWIWAGTSALNSINQNKCPTKSVITGSTYNKQNVMQIAAIAGSNTTHPTTRLICEDDVTQKASLPLKISFVANSSLNTYVSKFYLELFLASSSSSTTDIQTLITSTQIENVNKGEPENYTFNVRVPDLNIWYNPFGRDSYICAKITPNSNWTYARDVYFSVVNSSGTAVVNAVLKGDSTKTGCTGNFGIMWREFMANGYTLKVEFKPG